MKSILFVGFLFLGACAHHQALVPKGENVKVQREDFPATCENLGPVEGRNSNLKGDTEGAINDLRQETARVGGNAARLETTSSLGNSVRGTAYKCP